MRIDSIYIRNFRGIRHAEISDLADASIVTVSGPNGAGKSLLFEALTVLWRSTTPWGQLDVKRLVGPWGDSAELKAVFALTSEEQVALQAFGADKVEPEHGNAPSSMSLQTRISREGQFGTIEPVVDSRWGQIFWSTDFSSMHSFAHLDYLPADRSIQRGEQAQVNPAMLSAEQTEGLRQQVFNSFVQQRSILTLTGVQPFLASLDYLDMLADREGRPRSGDFEAITDPFETATRKKINRPVIDPLAPFGASLRVDTPAGSTHELDQLSSGEQEVLSLMFFVRRLNASGGLLLVDEPELHLHPSLQQLLFSVMEQVAERAQVWIVTHAPKLVTSAPLSAVLHMSPTDGTDSNQLVKASDEELRGRLLSDIGVHPVDVLQSDSIVVVEGSVDARRLLSALALTLSRSTIYIAGNGSGVEATARSLESGNALIPWIAIRDRDLLSDDDVVGMAQQSPHLFVWPFRTLENELLNPDLLTRTLSRAGREIEVDQIRDILRRLADGHRDEITADLIELELKRRFPYELDESTTPLEQRRAYLRAQIASAQNRLGLFDEVARDTEASLDKRWNHDWFKLMDGKRALGEIIKYTPYRNTADLVSALTHTIREEPTTMPPGLAMLNRRLEAMRGMSQT